MIAISFTKFEGRPGDVRSCSILLGDREIGTIEADFDDANFGRAVFAKRYVVAGYTVSLFDAEEDRYFPAGTDARAALSAAKSYARAKVRGS